MRPRKRTLQREELVCKLKKVPVRSTGHVSHTGAASMSRRAASSARRGSTGRAGAWPNALITAWWVMIRRLWRALTLLAGCKHTKDRGLHKESGGARAFSMRCAGSCGARQLGHAAHGHGERDGEANRGHLVRLDGADRLLTSRHSQLWLECRQPGVGMALTGDGARQEGLSCHVDSKQRAAVASQYVSCCCHAARIKERAGRRLLVIVRQRSIHSPT